MDHSPEQIGSSSADNRPSLGKLTRRGFIAASAATIASCKAASSTTSTGPNAPIKSTANKDYRTPSVDGPSLRNNAGNPSANFSKDAGTTFSRVLVSGNYIAITFDDGPHPQNTPRLLDMLAQRNIKATFYVIGRSVDLHPGVLRRTVAEGHEIGNHSHTHRLLSKLGDSEVRQEMKLCQDAIGRAAGVRPRTMRPPYGGLLQRQRELIQNEFGYPTILWSVDPLDWKRPGPSVVASRILTNTTAGGIVLAHDLHSQTVDAMPATLDGLLKKGFKFVTVSQLIAMKIDAGDAQASVKPTS
ncbi:MAG: polysaccharide deacetylase family protein [Akkermansiaceae bacterium]|nr:polysaccharide deacetylase family protein [Akkermansiaceae bacterium]MDP4646457.1 polysaccharide deacetylase family protein [Akkermansiaceae bacterium]MDP4720516.1 polysaccharide deacetylase family protein [Akkermansiaceae bacterium]MDP4780064.1 polysaccharide deacetylase family protein [Akkermansiaceae bacterium]MDP4847658.1 polysaccharide deacetylase family protein [Akkermansiaceae bacterium]